MTSTTHLTGPVVQINGRIIQRCAVCGEKLRDTRGVEIPLNKDGTLPKYGVWDENKFVQQDGPCWTIVDIQAEEELPKNFCIDLVE